MFFCFNFVIVLLVANVAMSNASACTEDMHCANMKLPDCVTSLKCLGNKCEPDTFSQGGTKCKSGEVVVASTRCRQNLCDDFGKCVESFREVKTPCSTGATILEACEHEVCDDKGQCVVEPITIFPSDRKPCREAIGCHAAAYCDGDRTCPDSKSVDGVACTLGNGNRCAGVCSGGRCTESPSCTTASPSTAPTTSLTTSTSTLPPTTSLTTSTSTLPPTTSSTTSTSALPPSTSTTTKATTITTTATTPPPTTSESNAITTSSSMSIEPATPVMSRTTTTASDSQVGESTSITELSTTTQILATSDSNSRESTASPSSSSTDDVLAMMKDGEGLETWAIGVIAGVSALVLLLVIAVIVGFVLRARRTSSAGGDGEQDKENDVPLQQSAPPRANIYATVPPLEPGNYTAPPARPPIGGVYDVAPPMLDE